MLHPRKQSRSRHRIEREESYTQNTMPHRVNQTLMFVLLMGCGVFVARAQTLGDGTGATHGGRRKMVQQKLVRRLSNRSISTDFHPGGLTAATNSPAASTLGPCGPGAHPGEPEILGAYLASQGTAVGSSKSCDGGQRKIKPAHTGMSVEEAAQPAAGGGGSIWSAGSAQSQTPARPPQVESSAKAGSTGNVAEPSPGTQSKEVKKSDAAVNPGGNEVIAALGAVTVAPAPGKPDLAAVTDATTSADPAEPGTPANSPGGDPAPAPPWIWQGSDQTPVRAGGRMPQRRPVYTILSESTVIPRLSGNADLGYSSQSQNQSPNYSDFNGGINLNASGSIYNPQLVSYRVWGGFDRRDAGFGTKGSNGNSFDYGGTFSLLQATPAPFTISVMQDSDKFGGTLSEPFNFDSRSIEVDGLIHQLPMNLSYHLGDGDTSSVTADGHAFEYRYKIADVVLSKKFDGFDVHLEEEYLHTFSKQTLTEPSAGSAPVEIADVGQTDNNLRASLDRKFGSRIMLNLNGNISKYIFDNLNSQSTNSTLTSFGGGLIWNITDKLTANFNGIFSQNAVNLLELLAQSSGISFPNPLPGVSVLNSSSKLFSTTAIYRPVRHWTFGATTSYNTAKFPELTAATLTTTGLGLTNRILSNDATAAFNHHVWKFDYFASASGGIQNYSYASGQVGLAKIFNVGSGITGGDDRTLRYGARFTIDQTDNPVFFSLLNTRDRVLDVDLARKERFIRFDGTASYSQREILYAGSTQHLNSLNFMLAANMSRVNFTASHYTSDTNQRFFGLISPVGGGSENPPLPPGLLAPPVFGRSKSDAAAASWRVLQNLQLDSRYTRFSFNIIGTEQMDQETWFDNSIQYHFGRFDIIGGFIHASGVIPTFDRQTNRAYFRIRFPFQLW